MARRWFSPGCFIGWVRGNGCPAWIVTGVAIVCVLGGFQNLIFYDTAYRGGGVLLIQSGLLSPFQHFTDDGLFSPFPTSEKVWRAPR